MDRGRNRLLTFLRSAFPKNRHFKKLPLSERRELERNWTKDVLDWAQTIIPDDPLLKHVLTLDPKDVLEDDLEELDIRCTAQMDKWSEEEAEQRKKEEQKADRPEYYLSLIYTRAPKLRNERLVFLDSNWGGAGPRGKDIRTAPNLEARFRFERDGDSIYRVVRVKRIWPDPAMPPKISVFIGRERASATIEEHLYSPKRK
jgi:hypothetical protein